MAIYYRIVQARWAATAMNGEGARLYGGRWNPPGLPGVYLAESRALAALEILVHAPREILQLEWRSIAVEVPDAWMDSAELAALPKHWREQPTSTAAQHFGAAWLRALEKPAIRLPSVIVPQEHALLVNPLHPQSAKLQCSAPERFTFDPSLSAS